MYNNKQLLDEVVICGIIKVEVSHLEVQIRWTEWHLHEGRELTLVTTRNSGASCFDLAELHRMVLLAVLTPICLYLSLCVDLQRPNQEEYPKKDCKKTWKPCTGVQLINKQRTDLLVFPRGTKSAKKELKKKKPDQYNHFEEIWSLLRATHASDKPTE